MGVQILIMWRAMQRRNLFSKTGQWVKLTMDVRREIEQNWKPTVQAAAANKNTNSQDKMYCLSMFPYPSGNLHMGHVRVYTISDTLAHFYRMNNKYVIHPMGWDSFGLPAENAARIHGVDAHEWTKSNVEKMRQQLDSLGFCFDWDRELSTCEPEYYKGTQAIFLELFKNGLAYRAKSLVNWDPVDETVLADEQVDSNGRSWRSGAKVEKKELTQWFIRTTRFAKRLMDGLESPQLEEWRDIINMQKHWIGKCDGYFMDVQTECGEKLRAWTRSPEERGLFMAVKKAHPLCSKKGITKEFFVNTSVIHPIHKNTLPVIILDMEEMQNDEDVYIGVASCQEDMDVASSLEISVPQTTDMSREQAVHCIKEQGLGDGDLVSHHLKDWLISRQRRWGTPIPMVLCSSCGPQPVPADQLPVIVPSTNVDLNEWKQTECPKCGGNADRETDTMDTFVDSSWYYLRFLDPKNDQRPFDPFKINPMMPVDLYIGGKEHAILHLYYARFMGHFLHSIGWLDQPEPFSRLLVQGMVKGKSYCLKESGKYLRPEEVDTSGKQPVQVGTGAPVTETWEKMSKSKFNGVSPEDVLKELGCDATRLVILADVAPTSHRNWSESYFPIMLNWQKKIWLTVDEFIGSRVNENLKISEDISAQLVKEEERLWTDRNYFLSGVSFNFGKSQQLSVAVTKMRGLTNSIRRTPNVLKGISTQFERALATQLILIAPMAPHFASELWAAFTSVGPMKTQEFDWQKSVLEQRWPKLDAEYKLDLNIMLNDREIATLKLSQEDFRTVQPSDVLRLAKGVDRFNNMLGSWEVTEVLLDRLDNYQLNAFINSVRTEKSGPQNVALQQQKRTKKPKGINKKTMVVEKIHAP